MDQLKAMRTFMRVADEGSFVGASRALDVAPAAVTRAVADLEQHLGARLLMRTTRSLSLTDIGTRYLERVRGILREVDEAAALASDAHAQARGHVRVRAPASFAVQQLGARLARFHAAHPEVTVEITADVVVESVDETHDINIVVRRDALDGGFIARRLACSEVIVCAQPEYLDRAGRPDHPQELAGHPLLVPATKAGRTLSFEHRSSGEAVTVTPAASALSTSHHGLNHSAALAGMGIAGVPSFLAARDLAEGRLERVLPDWRLFDMTIWACMPTRKQVPASTRAFMDFLVAEFAGEDRDPWLVPARPSVQPATPRPAVQRDDQKRRCKPAIDSSIAATGPITVTSFWPRVKTSRQGRSSVAFSA
jgi:DNA-binding transcriptional LysR family regulator